MRAVCDQELASAMVFSLVCGPGPQQEHDRWRRMVSAPMLELMDAAAGAGIWTPATEAKAGRRPRTSFPCSPDHGGQT